MRDATEMAPDPDQPVWRFYHGLWDPDPAGRAWTHHDEAELTWPQARLRARRVFEKHQRSGCAPCAADASAGLRALEAAWPGQPFTSSVEGDDVMILLAGGL